LHGEERVGRVLPGAAFTAHGARVGGSLGLFSIHRLSFSSVAALYDFCSRAGTPLLPPRTTHTLTTTHDVRDALRRDSCGQACPRRRNILQAGARNAANAAIPHTTCLTLLHRALLPLPHTSLQEPYLCIPLKTPVDAPHHAHRHLLLRACLITTYYITHCKQLPPCRHHMPALAALFLHLSCACLLRTIAAAAHARTRRVLARAS